MLTAFAGFLDKVLPLVHEVFADMRLHVVGANAPTAVTDAASEHVIIHGYLSDEELALQYRQARMVAVPLRYGAGVKGKVLEALQHGVPLGYHTHWRRGAFRIRTLFSMSRTPLRTLHRK